MSKININEIKKYFITLQETLCKGFSEEDGEAEFKTDSWERQAGGGGITRVITGGDVFEKGGINFSHVYGDQLPSQASAQRPNLAGLPFQAMGVSIVFHPHNPYVPTSHANVRFFVAEKPGEEPIWWFGGGYDLTPYYGFEEDCVHWHTVAKNVCDDFNKGAYQRYKAWCDDYFFLKHRNEPRGIGGIFFDDLNEADFDSCFNFVKQVGYSYLDAYRPIIAKRKNMPFGEKEKQFQCYRRGRYVEFNLIYDRGTLFGLQSGGRSESILMSLPPEVRWNYNWQPEPESEEARLNKVFLSSRDWV